MVFHAVSICEQPALLLAALNQEASAGGCVLPFPLPRQGEIWPMMRADNHDSVLAYQVVLIHYLLTSLLRDQHTYPCASEVGHLLGVDTVDLDNCVHKSPLQGRHMHAHYVVAQNKHMHLSDMYRQTRYTELDLVVVIRSMTTACIAMHLPTACLHEQETHPLSLLNFVFIILYEASSWEHVLIQ